MTTRIDSYPPWNKPSVAPSPVVPYDPLVPSLRPPAATAPPHPARPALTPPPAGFTRTQHAAPAAWPRQQRDSVGTCSRTSNPFGPDPVPANESKEARSARLVAEKDAVLTRTAAAKPWTAEDAASAEQPALWLSAERWRRDEPVPGGVTLVFAHANGLQKELWHPMARRLLEQESTPGSLFGTGPSGTRLSQNVPVAINDLWFIDDIYHGVSQDLNAGSLPPIYAWINYGRDVLNFVQHVLPQSQASDLPWQLGWEENKGRSVPNVVGVGHSYGGNGLVQASVTAPDAFSSLFLVEPLNQPKLGSANIPLTENPIVLNALKRRSEWPSYKDAASMRTNPMFKTWDTEAFELFISHGLVPTDPSNPDGQVTLATPRWSEAAIFSDPVGPQRGWDKLLELTVPTGLLMAGNASWMGGPKVAQEAAHRAPRSRNERFLDAGHLLSQEKPAEAGKALWRFLTTIAAGDWDKQAGKL